MTILLDRTTRVLVHGASGAIGRYQTTGMRAYGTNVVGRISRSGEQGGEIPSFRSIGEAQAAVRADLLVSYAGAGYVGACAAEAFKAGIRTVVAVAEDVPFRDIVAARDAGRAARGLLIGPNTNGILSPGEARVGFFASEFGSPGRVGVVSRSGTLIYGALIELSRVGIGQSTVVGIGGGLARGTSALTVRDMFEADNATDVVVLLGEVGSTEEEDLAAGVKARPGKPVVALIIGAVGSPDDAMGHSGALVYDGKGGFEDKVGALRDAGVHVISHLGELAETVKRVAARSAGVAIK
jgi:succinyl-CoA synthetase alpha subunit